MTLPQPSLLPGPLVALHSNLMPAALAHQRTRHPSRCRHTCQRPPHGPYNPHPEPGPKAPSRQHGPQRARRTVDALRHAVHGAQDGWVRTRVVHENDGRGERKCAREDLNE